jgi:hypothetical protein
MNLVTEQWAKEVKPIPSIYSEELSKLRDNEWGDTSREVVERLPTMNIWCHDVVDGNVYAVHLVEQV